MQFAWTNKCFIQWDSEEIELFTQLHDKIKQENIRKTLGFGTRPYLNLSHNKLSKLEPGTFSMLSDSQTLDLSTSELRKLNANKPTFFRWRQVTWIYFQLEIIDCMSLEDDKALSPVLRRAKRRTRIRDSKAIKTYPAHGISEHGKHINASSNFICLIIVATVIVTILLWLMRRKGTQSHPMVVINIRDPFDRKLPNYFGAVDYARNKNLEK